MQCGSYNSDELINERTSINRILSKGDVLLMGSNVQTLCVPASVGVIEERCFMGIKSLIRVTFEKFSRLKTIRASAFENTNIQGIEIPSSVEVLENSCFMCCKVTKVGINEDSMLRYIGDYAFSHSSIAEFTIPRLVEHLGDHCFAECKSLKRITFDDPSDLKCISKYAFYKSGIEKIGIPPSVTVIDEHCFDGSELRMVLEGENSLLARIESGAFQSCRIDEIHIPEGVTNIAGDAFACCTIQRITLPQSTFSLIDDAIASGSKFISCVRKVESVTIPEDVVEISDRCFRMCNELEKLSLGRVTTIGNYAFESCTSLKELKIPNTVTNIGKRCFAWCSSLTAVKFLETSKLQVIDDDAFLEAELESLTIPDSVERIGDRCFSDCYSLQSVTFTEQSALEFIGKEAFCGTAIAEITIPKSVRVIGMECFSSCRNLKTVEFTEPSVLQKIEESAFAGTEIVQMTIPESVSIISGAFIGCDINTLQIEKHTKFRVNAPLIYAHDQYIHACYKNISSITIPAKVVQICRRCFQNCSTLTSVTFEPGSRLKVIEERAFSGTGITEIELPTSLEVIGEYCFNDSYLSNVSFEDIERSSLRSIRMHAFAYCNISRFTIPARVKEIISPFKGEVPRNITIDKKNTHFVIIDSMILSADKTRLVAWFGTSDTVRIPREVEVISEHCFDSFEIRKVVFVANSCLKSIEKNAFQDKELLNVTIPETIKHVWITYLEMMNIKPISFPLFCS